MRLLLLLCYVLVPALAGPIVPSERSCEMEVYKAKFEGGVVSGGISIYDTPQFTDYEDCMQACCNQARGLYPSIVTTDVCNLAYFSIADNKCSLLYCPPGKCIANKYADDVDNFRVGSITLDDQSTDQAPPQTLPPVASDGGLPPVDQYPQQALPQVPGTQVPANSQQSLPGQLPEAQSQFPTGQTLPESESSQPLPVVSDQSQASPQLPPLQTGDSQPSQYLPEQTGQYQPDQSQGAPQSPPLQTDGSQSASNALPAQTGTQETGSAGSWVFNQATNQWEFVNGDSPVPADAVAGVAPQVAVNQSLEAVNATDGTTPKPEGTTKAKGGWWWNSSDDDDDEEDDDYDEEGNYYEDDQYTEEEEEEWEKEFEEEEEEEEKEWEEELAEWEAEMNETTTAYQGSTPQPLATTAGAKLAQNQDQNQDQFLNPVEPIDDNEGQYYKPETFSNNQESAWAINAPVIAVGSVAAVILLLLVIVLLGKKMTGTTDRAQYKPLRESFSGSSTYHEDI